MSAPAPALVWLRNDLRLADNPALAAAVDTGRPVVCTYILETPAAGQRRLGGAARWWLDKSLRHLAAEIAQRGGQLVLRRGKARAALERLVEDTGAHAVYWNRRYDGGGRAVDAEIKTSLRDRGVGVDSFNGSLLTEPWTVRTGAGGYYKVFTPYWKAVRAGYTAPDPLPAPARLCGKGIESDRLDAWGLHPSQPDWSTGFDAVWTPGEAGAQARLSQWIETGLAAYDACRNRPDIETGTSGLSPHLRWGEVGPAQVWRAVQARIEAGETDADSAWVFLSEIVWREFAYVLLYHNPDLAEENYNPDFRLMPWRDSEADYRAWTDGRTGFPIVDAGMRQLWSIGWMHNRVRMIAGSLLTKHLLLPWQWGEDWFWDTLVDADPASNSASWQWVAGSGADAAPYFRVFNPITQGQKFDPDGAYVRRWCPELSRLPDRYLHAPWTAPEAVLRQAGIRLDETYPRPVIDHSDGRKRALDAYDTLKERRMTA